jgi:hypothetical protein
MDQPQRKIRDMDAGIWPMANQPGTGTAGGSRMESS